MEFWLVSAFLTFVAVMVVMLPLTRKFVTTTLQGERDRSVYLQQLKEVDADLARGLLDAASAEQARLEISRRILSNERQSKLDIPATLETPAQSNTETAASDYIKSQGDFALSRSARWSVLAVVLFIPVISWSVYATTGTPDLPSQPLAERKGNGIQDRSAADLIAQAEAHLAKTPDDGRGWSVLAPIYLRLGRVDDSIHAYRQALRLLGDDADRLIGLGEALVVKAQGVVGQEAQGLFEQAAKLSPEDLRPRLMQVRMKIQDGKKDQAIALLQAILDKAPNDAVWRGDIERTIAQLRGATAAPAIAKPAASADNPMPSAEAIEAAGQLNDADRKEMIRSMVSGLAAKLADNPADVDGWQRLLRAYVVLNEPAVADEALRRAVKALPATDAQALVIFAGELGLDVSGVLP